MEKEVVCGETRRRRGGRVTELGDKGGSWGRRGLSAFDVKSLRQKRSRAECCSTCCGNRRWQRQRGDGEDEGGEIKRGGEKYRHGGGKMRKSRET